MQRGIKKTWTRCPSKAHTIDVIVYRSRRLPSLPISLSRWVISRSSFMSLSTKHGDHAESKVQSSAEQNFPLQLTMRSIRSPVTCMTSERIEGEALEA